MTNRQVEELERLNTEPQRTFGKGRARVQNTLVRLGLATYPHFYECRITEEGKSLFESLRRKAKR